MVPVSPVRPAVLPASAPIQRRPLAVRPKEDDHDHDGGLLHAISEKIELTDKFLISKEAAVVYLGAASSLTKVKGLATAAEFIAGEADTIASVVAGAGKFAPALKVLGKVSVGFAKIAPILGVITTLNDIYHTAVEKDPVKKEQGIGHTLLCGAATVLTFVAFAAPVVAPIAGIISAVQLIDMFVFKEKGAGYLGKGAKAVWNAVFGK